MADRIREYVGKACKIRDDGANGMTNGEDELLGIARILMGQHVIQGEYGNENR